MPERFTAYGIEQQIMAQYIVAGDATIEAYDASAESINKFPNYGD